MVYLIDNIVNVPPVIVSYKILHPLKPDIGVIEARVWLLWSWDIIHRDVR